jgi:hypothetical protein
MVARTGAVKRLVHGCSALCVAFVFACAGRSERDAGNGDGAGGTGGTGGSAGGTGGASGTPGAAGRIICSAAVAMCPPGESLVAPGNQCPADHSCYEHHQHCQRITCAVPPCDPSTEYNRDYVALGTQCESTDFYCAPYTFGFVNDCGCGCEQGFDCPPSFDCSRGAEPVPECEEVQYERCPFSERLR